MGGTFVTDEQLAFAKYVQEGWLTTAEQSHLDAWSKETSWMDNAAGRVLSASEKAGMLLNLGNTMLTEGWGKAANGNSLGNGVKKGDGISKDADGFGEGSKGIDKIFEAGRTPKASELKEYAEAQGWKPSQTDGGPLKYVDENGIPRVTIKQGSSRAP
jgi:filamentous hemagglutinin